MTRARDLADSADLAFDGDTLKIDSANNRVGVGTASPANPLHVSATGLSTPALVESTSTVARIAFKDTATTNANTVRLGSAGDDMSFLAGGAERMRIDSSGSVGIGTSSPTSYANSQKTLVVTDTTSPAIALNDTGQGREWYIVAQGSGLYLRYADGGGSGSATNVVNSLYLDNAGNVGIGTDSPPVGLSVQRSSENATLQLKCTSTGGRDYRITSRFDGSLRFNDDSAGSERMRITSSGNIGIGTTSPADKVDIKGTLGIEATGSTNRWKINTHTDNSFRINYNGAGADEVVIDTLGRPFITGAYTYTTAASANMFVASSGQFFRSTSSNRYKNTVNDATHGLTELLTLRPVTYKGNNDGDTIFGGLIAEEVHAAGLTEFIEYSQDDNGDDQPESIHYAHMVSLCIKSIQELKAKLDAAEARITTLENA